jgi:hypothetical protein
MQLSVRLRLHMGYAVLELLQSAHIGKMDRGELKYHVVYAVIKQCLAISTGHVLRSPFDKDPYCARPADSARL